MNLAFAFYASALFSTASQLETPLGAPNQECLLSRMNKAHKGQKIKRNGSKDKPLVRDNCFDKL